MAYFDTIRSQLNHVKKQVFAFFIISILLFIIN
ncbi:hypothetical protein HD_1434 [[Haemophilus] ducreyi 35000HP]|uniref:Uncharacterized protein n=1 Tax=Haemophilus ducreyi (strain 35000HP / ATCC 700724) TaxID=233412 RepID=Q7VLJ7_HAEDU|nr:hypothetical protein HD_1434 [[Haemophilus] ducreyi 35000HP]